MRWPFGTRRKKPDVWSRLSTVSAEAAIEAIEANRLELAQMMQERAVLHARHRELTERLHGMQDTEELLSEEVRAVEAENRAVEAETARIRADNEIQKQRIGELTDRHNQLLAVLKTEDALDIFQRTRDFVDARLEEVAPAALSQLSAAYRRRADADPEALSHAATSCRRALKVWLTPCMPRTASWS